MINRHIKQERSERSVMVPGLQIAGLFLAISAALAFTTWAETWLASTSAPTSGRRRNAKQSVERELAEHGDDVIRAA